MLRQDIYYMDDNQICVSRVIGTRVQTLTEPPGEVVRLELESGKQLDETEACLSLDDLFKQLNAQFRASQENC